MRGRLARPGRVQDRESERIAFSSIGGCGLRCSLDRTIAVPVTNLTAKTALHWVPVGSSSDKCEAWNGREFVPRTVPYDPDTANQRDLTWLDISPLANASTHDVFVRWMGGRWQMRAIPWNSTTARWASAPAVPWLDASGLAVFRGRLVCPQNGGTYASPSPLRMPDWLYLCTIYTSAAGQCTDSDTQRFVWNFYNPADRRMYILVSNNHTYNVATYRQWNADSTAKVEYVCGIQRAMQALSFGGLCQAGASGSNFYITWMLDGTNNNSSLVGYGGLTGLNIQHVPRWSEVATPGLGYHYLALIEYGVVATPPTFWTHSIIVEWSM